MRLAPQQPPKMQKRIIHDGMIPHDCWTWPCNTLASPQNYIIDLHNSGIVILKSNCEELGWFVSNQDNPSYGLFSLILFKIIFIFNETIISTWENRKIMILRAVFLSITHKFFLDAAAYTFEETSCPSSEAYALCGSDCAENYFQCVIDCEDDLFCSGDCVRSEAACRQGIHGK